MKERTATVARVTDIAPGVVALELSVDGGSPLHIKAGQFFSLRMPDGRSRRSFSAVSPPGERLEFELLLKPSTVGVTGEFVASLEVGQKVRFFGPMGFFQLDDQHPGDVVFAATGVGVSAVFPMLYEVLARQAEPGRVLFFWGLRHEADLFFADRLAELATDSPRFEFEVRFSRSGQGRITPRVAELSRSLTEPVFYLCGNSGMVRDISQIARSVGSDAVRTEVFQY